MTAGLVNAGRARGVQRAVWLSALLASSAQGQPAAEPPVFVVQIAAAPQERAAFREILSDVADRHDVGLQISSVARIDANAIIRGPSGPRPHPPLGRAFVDLADAAVVTLYVVDGTWDRILVREIVRSSNPDVDREVVGRMISTAVEALLAGSFVQSSEPIAGFVASAPRAANPSSREPRLPQPEAVRAPPPQPEAVRAPPPQPEVVRASPPTQDVMRPSVAPEDLVRPLGQGRRDLFGSAAPGIGAGYEAQLVGSGRTFGHGPALYGELAFGKGTVRPLVWLSGQYRLPVSRDAPSAADRSAGGPSIGYRMDTTALRLLAGAQIALAHQVTFEAGAGVGLDIIGMDPRSAAGDQVHLSKKSPVIKLGRAMVGVRWRWSRFVSARAVLLADIDGSNTRFVFGNDQNSQEVVLALYGIRPGLALSLSMH